jgi:D-psicose/D-tagatose/L-ribulose 3-epimerase
MKVGMNLLLWTGAATEKHIPLIRKIKSWGYDGVELPMFSPDSSPWEKLAKEMDKLGLGRTVVTVMPKGANLIGENASERAAGVAHLKVCLDAAKIVGADALCGPIYSPVGRLVGRGPNKQEEKWCVEGLKAAGEHAKKVGIPLSIEPLNRFETYFVNTQVDSARIIDAVKNPMVGQMYDTFHANIEEKNLTEAIKKGGKRINHVHISANDRATPGEDHIGYAETFAGLKSIGYDGWLTIEAFGSWLPDLAGATCIWRKMAPSEEHVAKGGLKTVREGWKKARAEKGK